MGVAKFGLDGEVDDGLEVGAGESSVFLPR
jgi:hypothetical protein